MEADDEGLQTLELLIKTCQPATFGLGSKDVYDENYRKAIKLDETDFSTNFNPYVAGIIDAIGQALLPSGHEQRGIRAELYKLNVCTLFKISQINTRLPCHRSTTLVHPES